MSYCRVKREKDNSQSRGIASTSSRLCGPCAVAGKPRAEGPVDRRLTLLCLILLGCCHQLVPHHCHHLTCCLCCLLFPFLFLSGCRGCICYAVCTTASVAPPQHCSPPPPPPLNTLKPHQLCCSSASLLLLPPAPLPPLLLPLRAHLNPVGCLLSDCHQAPHPHYFTSPLSRKRAITGRVLSPLHLVV